VSYGICLYIIWRCEGKSDDIILIYYHRISLEELMKTSIGIANFQVKNGIQNLPNARYNANHLVADLGK
jgi:hypothetical protein